MDQELFPPMLSPDTPHLTPCTCQCDHRLLSYPAGGILDYKISMIDLAVPRLFQSVVCIERMIEWNASQRRSLESTVGVPIFSNSGTLVSKLETLVSVFDLVSKEL